jgi:hypothetical protein
MKKISGNFTVDAINCFQSEARSDHARIIPEKSTNGPEPRIFYQRNIGDC